MLEKLDLLKKISIFPLLAPFNMGLSSKKLALVITFCNYKTPKGKNCFVFYLLVNILINI